MFIPSPLQDSHSLPHTLALFGMIIDDLPPLVPETLREDMQHAYEHMAHDVHLTATELDDTMIVFGKRVWPYRQAFAEFYDEFEGLLGERFLLERLSAKAKKRYQEFLTYGGTFRDLVSGRPAGFFASVEREELHRVLVHVEQDIREYTVQAVLSTERVRYDKRIQEFTQVLADIETELGTLRSMADSEQEHPDLAAEIRAQVRSFEYGLALLGPPHRLEAVKKAPEHFSGRKVEKSMRA
jgi:hypothetical protein